MIGLLFRFYGSSFVSGFIIGVGIRLLFSLLFRLDMTWGGVFRTGLFFAALRIISETYLVLTIN